MKELTGFLGKLKQLITGVDYYKGDHQKIYSYSDFSTFQNEVIAERQRHEKEIALKCANAGGYISVPGFCEICREETQFQLDFLYSDGVTPNFRERLVCPKCGLNNRQRYIVSTLLKNIVPPPEYIYV